MTIETSMTLGDVIVAAAGVISVATCYHALKGLLSKVITRIAELEDTLRQHDERLDHHGQSLAALHTKVFGRRFEDKYPTRRRRYGGPETQET